MDDVFAVRVAIDAGNTGEAVRLVRALSNPNAQGDHGRSPLHFAAWHKGTGPVIAALLECGADVNIRSDYDGTPLFGAACHNDPEVVRQLLDAGADVHLTDGEGDTALHFTSFQNAPVLLEHGADANVADSQGKTPLHTAAQRDEPEVCALLIRSGADANARTRDGKTALRLAVEEDFADSCRALLDAGADASVRADDGLTPEEWAKQHSSSCPLVLEEIFPTA